MAYCEYSVKMRGQAYFVTSVLSLWAWPASANTFREVAVILGGNQTSVEVYTGKDSRKGGLLP